LKMPELSIKRTWLPVVFLTIAAIAGTSLCLKFRGRGVDHNTINSSSGPRPEMVRILGGSTTVKRPYLNTAIGPRESAVLRVKDYYLDTTEVTNDAYQKCVEAGGCTQIKLNSWNEKKGPDHPVVNVSWTQADAFCKWRGKRLPTVNEWEWAARAGYTGKKVPHLDDGAWYRKNSGWTNNYPNASEPPLPDGPYSGTTTHPVATKQPNAWGLYDLLGNVWEWASDLKGPEYSPIPSASHPDHATGRMHPVLGGSWYSYDSYLTYEFRSTLDEESTGITIGFRCAKD